MIKTSATARAAATRSGGAVTTVKMIGRAPSVNNASRDSARRIG